MGQFVMAVKGIGEACRILEFPIVSGNVSLYNETNGKAILPTPAIGGVGLIADVGRMATLAFKSEGDDILLIGGHGRHLGQSLYLREIHSREEGPPPPVDLEQEKRHGDFIRTLIRAGKVTACHDISDGGLLVALAEMGLAGMRGAYIQANDMLDHISLFAEDQARYLVTCRPAETEMLLARARNAAIDAIRLGRVSGIALIVEGLVSISLDELKAAHEGWFPAFMQA
jgi:phosphoribosylformylglycinamidine synthase